MLVLSRGLEALPSLEAAPARTGAVALPAVLAAQVPLAAVRWGWKRFVLHACAIPGSCSASWPSAALLGDLRVDEHGTLPSLILECVTHIPLPALRCMLCAPPPAGV